MTEKLRRDVYPAEVLLPDGTLLRKARVFITVDRLVIWTLGANREVESREYSVIHDSVPLNHNTLPVGGRIEVPLVDGVVHITRAGGCGCGSKLKRMPAPFAWH